MYLYVCPAVGFTCADTMADLNIPADDVPISKSNCVLDVLKSQRNLIFLVAVAILKNTNLFRAFTASSTIPAIYIQQFWEIIHYDSTIGMYNYQLDEQRFILHKYILRDALQITPINDNGPFVAPPLSEIVIEYVNTLGYPCKTAGHDRPRHPVLQILWGIIHRSNIDYAERIWEEIVQSIRTFLTDKKSLTMATRGKKKSVGKDGREIFSMPIPDAFLTDVIKRAPYYNGYLEHVAEYQRYQDEERGKVEEEAVTESPKATKVTKPKAAMQTKPSAPKVTKVTKPADDKAPKPTSSQLPKHKPTPTKPTKAVPEKKRKLVKETPDEPSPTKRSKGGLVGKRRKPKSPLKLVDEFVDEGVPVKEPAYNDEEVNLQWALELTLKEQVERTQGPEQNNLKITTKPKKPKINFRI
ncbi:hypothetical protein Tco_1000754 [Tanacetum coccineum]